MENWPKNDAVKVAWCRGKGIDPSRHCCLDMAYAISEPVLIEHQGANPVIHWIAAWNEYLIPVSLKGYSSTDIRFCPFCGAKLGETLRQKWYKTLRAMGYDDPGEQEVPEEFNSDAWWRKTRE